MSEYFDFGSYGSEYEYLLVFNEGWQYTLNSIVSPAINDFHRRDDSLRTDDVQRIKNKIAIDWDNVFEDPDYPAEYMEKAFRRPSARLEELLSEKVSGSDAVKWIVNIESTVESFLDLSRAMLNQLERRKADFLTPI